MFGRTSISAIRALLYLAQDGATQPVSPRRMAEALEESPSYLAKITRQLVKAAILRADRGSKGGVKLARSPNEITLLQVMEACQGTIVGDFCRGSLPRRQQCAFHQAAVELYEAIVGVLARWTLQDLMARIESSATNPAGEACLMRGVTRRSAQPVLDSLSGGNRR